MNGELFISLVNPMMAGIFACMFACVWLKIRKRYLGYVAAACCVAVVMFLIPSFWPLPDRSANVIALNVTLLVVIILLSKATLVRAGQRVPVIDLIIITAVYMIALVWALYVQPSLPARVHIADIAMLAIMLLTLRGQIHARTTLADNILIAVSAMMAFYFSWRSIAFLLFQVESLQPGTSAANLYWTINLLMTLAMAVVFAIGYIVVLAHDLYDQIRKEARIDQLSGILNRRGFQGAAQSWLEQNPDTPATLIMADIDHFKRINDTYGHTAGDQAILRFGQLLAQYAGQGYVVGRIGGEEFAVLIPRAASQEALSYVGTIRQILAQQSVPSLPKDFRFTASFGLRSRSAAEMLSDMLRGADRALYSAKADGRNSVSTDFGAAPAS